MNQKNVSINLKELSHLTGFSVSTVSKALNDKVDISTKTKKIVIKIAEKHNYVPNSLAAGLRNNKSYTIAVILPQVNVNFYGDLLFYFQQIADRRGYRILIFQSFESEIKELEHLKSISDGSIDGAIVIRGKEENFNRNQYSIPILTISIKEALEAADLESFSHTMFETFLVNIT